MPPLTKIIRLKNNLRGLARCWALPRASWTARAAERSRTTPSAARAIAATPDSDTYPPLVSAQALELSELNPREHIVVRTDERTTPGLQRERFGSLSTSARRTLFHRDRSDRHPAQARGDRCNRALWPTISSRTRPWPPRGCRVPGASPLIEAGCAKPRSARWRSGWGGGGGRLGLPTEQARVTPASSFADRVRHRPPLASSLARRGRALPARLGWSNFLRAATTTRSHAWR